jgi:hypothetical protein
MIGLYSGAGFKSVHPSNMDYNRQIAEALVSRSVRHYMSINLSLTPAYNIGFWQMLADAGMSAGCVLPYDPITATTEQVDGMAYLNDIPNLSHVMLGHEVYESVTWLKRRDARQMYQQVLTKPVRWYWGVLDVPNHRTGWCNPAGEMWQDYQFGNEADLLKGDGVIIHVCPGKSGENDLPAHWNDEPNWVVEKFLSQRYFIDRYSPHGHRIAVHINVRADYTDTKCIGYTLARLNRFADYVYLRPDGLVTSAQLDGIAVSRPLVNE